MTTKINLSVFLDTKQNHKITGMMCLCECGDLGLLWWSGLAIFTVTGLRTAGKLRGLRTFFFLKPSHLTGGRTPTDETPGCCRG